MKPLALAVCLLVLLVPSRSYAERRDNFAPCTKSNDCKSLRCSENVCKPSGSWNGHGVLGSQCENDSNCKSRECKAQRCVAAPAPNPTPKKGASSKPDGSGTPAVVNDTNEPIPLNDCGKDLRATVFADGGKFADDYAHTVCRDYSAEIIAKAKVLWSAGYGKNFTRLCKVIENHTEDEIECARKEIDALPAEKKTRAQLTVRGNCRARSEKN